MPEKIGKYQIVERIGRGGMGVVYKAHDPILDRSVALKVISPEVEVSDELRARFFREAQACARLSHPNIVTVYDMGEEDGRLFIVMELLEGEELRRLITHRKELPIEDKLSIMVQVCEGLHYAHQKGIVHRDIKPGNIMLQRNGQVKILDFGIAQMATKEGGLTRTGLIMGTLRYIAPEQVRGRADQRSDMFSVGSVFYELLTYRPPFTGDDPIQLLEQLRTEDPPGLLGLDPSIPADLAAVVERAMRKDAGERYADLGKMRAELEVVQRRLGEEAQRAHRRIRAQIDQLRAVQMDLDRRIGGSTVEQTIPGIDEQARLEALQTLDRELASRIEALLAKVARADALSPAFQRGTELLQAGQFADAVAEFEAMLADMPEHEAAREALAEARAQAEAQRRRQLAAKLVQDARAALDEGAYALCLGILQQAGDIPPPAEAAEGIDALRRSAETALARQEAARRARQQAERAREQMAQARRRAQEQGAPPYALALWTEAETKASEGHAAFAREGYAEALEAFEAAAATYRRFEEAVRAAQQREREAAEETRNQMMQGQRQAQEAGAAAYAQELWEAAETKAVEATSAVARNAHGRAIAVFNEAAALYRQAGEAAREARQREREQAVEARDQAARSREGAAEVDAEHAAPDLWREATVKSAAAEAALVQERYAKAAGAFGAALALYRQAESQARDVRRRQREQAEQARQAMLGHRSNAVAVGAATHAASDWSEAESNAAAGDAALACEAYAEARSAFDQGAVLYGRAEIGAREAVRVRADADRAREAASLARHAAAEAHATRYASEPWTAGEGAETRANAALGRQDYGEARRLFAEARRLYASAAQAAGVAAEAETRRVNAMMGDARRLLESGELAACLRRLNEVLALRPGWKPAEELRHESEEKLRRMEAAAREGAVSAQSEAFRSQDDVALIAPSPLHEPTHDLVEAPPAPPAVAGPPPVAPEPTTAVTTARAAPASPVSAEKSASPREVPSVEPSRESRDATPAAATGGDDATVAMTSATVYAQPVRIPSQVSGVASAQGAEPPTVIVRAPTTARADRTPSERARGSRDATPSDRARLSIPGSRRLIVRARAMFVALGLGTIAAVILFVMPWPRGGPPDLPPPPALEELRKQVAAARDEAMRAGAEPFPQFARAATEERAGETALGQRDGATAQDRYRDALRGYRLAQTEAEQARAAALTTQSRAAEARKAAETAEAPKRAASLWAKAEAIQRDAESALEQRTFDRARTLFAEADTIYRQAEQLAVAGLRKDDRAVAERARTVTISARQKAEQADARRLATKSFASAQQKEDQAEEALDRDPAAAKLAFQEALRGYKRAAQEAATQQVARARVEAAQAQARMTNARRDAEQSGAAQRAPVLFAWAQKKEREAGAALGRSEYAVAERLFSETQDDYDTAAQEAKRPGEVGASARSSAEQARRRAVLYRDRAVTAEVERLARDLFGIARAKEVGADELIRQQSYALAAQAYGEVGDRYLAAGRRASERLEADNARSRMQAEKQRADQRAPAYRDAQAEETQGASAYERLAYKEAAERFGTARTFYARAATKAVAGPPSAPPVRSR